MVGTKTIRPADLSFAKRLGGFLCFRGTYFVRFTKSFGYDPSLTSHYGENKANSLVPLSFPVQQLPDFLVEVGVNALCAVEDVVFCLCFILCLC